MCNPVTLTVQSTEKEYESYREAYYEYDQEAIEKMILDNIFDGPFWDAVGHYINSLSLSDDAKNVLFNIIKKQTVICVSAPDLEQP